MSFQCTCNYYKIYFCKSLSIWPVRIAPSIFTSPSIFPTSMPSL